MKNEDSYLYDCRDDHPMCEPDDTQDECCQGCGHLFDPSDVMIVDDVGPVCANCQWHLVQRYFSGG